MRLKTQIMCHGKPKLYMKHNAVLPISDTINTKIHIWLSKTGKDNTV